MKIFEAVLVGSLIAFSGLAAAQNCPYDPRCISNPYGAGNPYGPIMNPYAPNSATNPYATEAPRLYDSQGNYRGQLSSNPYAPDSTSNPYGVMGILIRQTVSTIPTVRRIPITLD